MPDDIWKPFREPAGTFSTAIIRPLYALFSNSKQNAGLRLHPSTLAATISLILHAQPSLQQQRVLHNLTEVARLYQDDDALSRAFKQQKLAGMKANKIREYQETLSSRLLFTTIRVVDSQTVTLEGRRCAAQILSVAAKGTPNVKDILDAARDFSRLGNVLQSSGDYLLRFLVGDTIRELQHKGMNRTHLWPPELNFDQASYFPISQHSTLSWLLDLREYLSKADQKYAFDNR